MDDFACAAAEALYRKMLVTLGASVDLDLRNAPLSVALAFAQCWTDAYATHGHIADEEARHRQITRDMIAWIFATFPKALHGRTLM